MDRYPAWYPDIVVYDLADLPKSWTVRVRHNGMPMDLTNLQISAPVTDDGVAKGNLQVDLSEGLVGKVTLTLTESLFLTLSRMSTWIIRDDSSYNVPLVRSRIVRPL